MNHERIADSAVLYSCNNDLISFLLVGKRDSSKKGTKEQKKAGEPVLLQKRAEYSVYFEVH